MWIEIETNTVKLRNEHTNGVVEFNDSGTAQVSQEVGEALINNYDTITES